jgi:hypothetical protein
VRDDGREPAVHEELDYPREDDHQHDDYLDVYVRRLDKRQNTMRSC